MIGRKYRCRAVHEIPHVRDGEELAELQALLPTSFVVGNVAEVNGIARREPDSLILFSREADVHGGTRRVYEMPSWAFSAWFEEIA